MIRLRCRMILPAVAFVASVLACAFSAPAQALLQVGMDAPAFSLKDTGGAETSLSRYAPKKAVVLVFWSTGSGKSRQALKRFEEFHRKYGGKDIQVIGINADGQKPTAEHVDEVRNLVRDLDITFPVLMDDGLKTFHDYNVIALPTTVVVSGGKITYELAGLPLVKTEEMFDHLLTVAGETPRRKMEPVRRPQHDAIANTNLAMGFVRKKRSEMAVPLFRKAIEKDPKYMLPYVELAKLYRADGRDKEAEEILRKALETEPDNVVVMSELGFLLAKRGEIKEAVEILGKAVTMNSYTPAHYYYAYTLAMGGSMNESLDFFNNAVSLNPHDPMTYILRGQAYEHHKMVKEASLDYKKALQLLLRVEE